MISFPGSPLRLTHIDWKAQLAECLSIRFICNLNVSKMDIGAEGAITIAEALKTNSTLQDLDLMYNKIGDKGAIAIAKASKINSTLQDLDLMYNQIGDKGAIAIAKALKGLINPW